MLKPRIKGQGNGEWRVGGSALKKNCQAKIKG